MSLSAAARTYVVNQSKYARLNAFISLVDPSVLVARTGDRLRIDDYFSILDKPIAIKDNICTKEFKTTAASATLKDFTSPYDATVVTLLQDAGAVVVGKTNMDEFGMGSHSTHSKFGPVKMQRYEGEEASAGGSSGGSALAVASAQCWAALGTDTGGSIRLPAAYTGVAGFKPSYGLLSRWGVIAYANSLDTVGIFARSTRCVRLIFDQLNEHDPQDPTSMSLPTRSRLTPSKYRKSWRIGIPLDYNIATLHPTVRKAWIGVLRRLWEDGHTLHPVRLPATQHALSAYYVLAPAEASSNLAKYDGVRYGSRAEGIDGTAESVLFAKTRAQGFGPEVQRRILLGAFSLSAQAIDNYFVQAQKVRRLVQKDFDRVFAKANPLLDHEEPQQETDEKVDILICPTAPSPAPSLADVTHQDPIQAYMNDVFTVPASLAGLPAISIPIPISEIHPKQPESDDTSFIDSVGIQVIGQYGDDTVVLDIAEKIQGFAPSPQIGTGPDTTAWGESMLGQTTLNERRKYSSTARFLGLSIKEHKAKLITEQKQETLAKLTATLEAACGTQHLEDAATFCGMTREDYIEKFIGHDNPIAAESRYFTKLRKQQEKAYANGNAHPQSRTLDALTNLLYSSTGQKVIDAAAQQFGESRSRYIGRFIGLEDPVASERRHYRYRTEPKVRVPNGRLKSDEEVVHGGPDDAVQQIWITQYRPHPRGHYGRL